PQESYSLPLPVAGEWIELLNTDATRYGGSGVMNERVERLSKPVRGLDFSATVRIPPLGTVWFSLKK
ncbi:MAG: alpha amylase C-terminal domain-containing protein, partial [Actinomycetota bacterium]